ncbi:MAG: tetratricopeptide repeat protein [Thermoguttaceae bacterium]
MTVANRSMGNAEVRINTSWRGAIWASVLVLAVFGGACGRSPSEMAPAVHNENADEEHVERERRERDAKAEQDRRNQAIRERVIASKVAREREATAKVEQEREAAAKAEQERKERERRATRATLEGLDKTALRLAAERGEPAAQRLLADCYVYGVGVENNEQEAIKWYRKAGEQGDAAAQLVLSNWYALKGDFAEAKYWAERAGDGLGEQVSKESLIVLAKNDDLGAIWRVANSYLDGTNGFEKNEQEARRWLRKGAELGSANAQLAIGVFYKEGRGGLQKDAHEAARWFQQSAAQGNARAQFMLAGCYFFGDGVEKDLAEYERLMRQSAANGYQPAKENLNARQRALQGLL